MIAVYADEGGNVIWKNGRSHSLMERLLFYHIFLNINKYSWAISRKLYFILLVFQ